MPLQTTGNVHKIKKSLLLKSEGDFFLSQAFVFHGITPACVAQSGRGCSCPFFAGLGSSIFIN
jgi:hypothetical protein